MSGYNTYIGARYVPVFDGEWDNTKEYEPLIIVSYQGNSYTSKTFVPKNASINDTKYWALTGNYNAQVEAYRQEVSNLKSNIESYVDYVFDTVSYIDLNVAVAGKLISTLGFYEIGDGGAGTYLISNSVSESDLFITIGTLYGILIHSNDVNIKQLGAKSDGSTDVASLINEVLSKVDNVFVPEGTYLLSSKNYDVSGQNYDACILINSDNKLYGDNAVLKMMDNAKSLTSKSLGMIAIHGQNSNNITIKGIKFDMNGENNTMTGSERLVLYAINMLNVSDSLVEDVTIENSSGRNAIRFSTSDTSDYYNHVGTRNVINKCIVHNYGTQISSVQDDWSAIYVESSDSYITDNIIYSDDKPNNHAGGIEIHNDNTFCQRNICKNCYPAVYLASSIALHPIKNINVSHNTFMQCVRGVQLFENTVLKNIVIDSNVFTGDTFGQSSSAFGIYSAKKDVPPFCDGLIITNNTFDNNDHTGSGILLCNNKNVVISNNTVRNYVSTGVYIDASSDDNNENITISNNVFENCRDDVAGNVFTMNFTESSIYNLLCVQNIFSNENQTPNDYNLTVQSGHFGNIKVGDSITYHGTQVRYNIDASGNAIPWDDTRIASLENVVNSKSTTFEGDVDTLKDSGYYNVSNASTNIPEAQVGTLIVFAGLKSGSAYRTSQLYIDANGAFTRFFNGTSWSAWVTL